MSETREIRIPDIGDFKDVEVIDVLVRPGDRIEAETALITLESDKATIDIPSPVAGTVAELRIKVGDRVSRDSPIMTVQVEAVSTEPASASGTAADEPDRAPATVPEGADLQVDLIVLGAGPGGYTAAFRAADLGLSVALIEREPTLGGVCLNVGCIPSKALLHAARVIEDGRQMQAHGIRFTGLEIDLPRLRDWKQSVVGQLTGGLARLARQRKVQVIEGRGSFAGPNLIEVRTAAGMRRVAFRQAIIAAGSEPVALPSLPADPRVIDSTGALALADVPERMLIIGGGIIGLEMATVYAALGSRVTIVELLDELVAGADRDLVRPLEQRLRKQVERILPGTRVTGARAEAAGIVVSMQGPEGAIEERFDRVLVAVGRRPNGAVIGADRAGVAVTAQGFITVDRQQRTNVPHIFAIGDVVGQPMLAHKASHEGKVAAEVAAGHKSAFEAGVIASVAYTDPEIAWVGLTETQARAQGLQIGKGVFPWAASGRSLTLGRSEGLTKLLFDRDSGRVVGGGIVGPGAGDLIAEVALAIEMGCDAADIGLTVHPHPTLSETVAMAAEAYEGTITDLYLPRR
ncbi:MAG: dihydrolipoyl dehydrogenase [Gammaproteobacteria bacterium]